MGLVGKDLWDAFLERKPDSHILQTYQWGEFKSGFGWKPVRLISGDTGAQVLFRYFPFGLSFAYVPKGPIGKNEQGFYKELVKICKNKNSFAVYVEPDQLNNENVEFQFNAFGFERSDISIQPRRTITVSLRGSESDWLSRMKQKTRYNIRLAEKKDVVVKISKDIDIFNQLIKTTGERGQFGVHSEQYYKSVFEIFSKKEDCVLLIAYYKEQPLAGLLLFIKGKRAWYFYGASNDLERNRMPTYLIQFKAMQIAAGHGCEEYDLWGVPDFPLEELEENFMNRNDGLWSVYRFKRGFGGELHRTAGVFQRILRPEIYHLYQFAYRFRKRDFA